MGNIFSNTPALYSVPTPIPAILDFDPDKSTPESEAKSVLLSKDPSHNSISLYGQGGVGKTTILRVLAVQPEILQAFPDGIYMIELGQDAKLDLLQHKLIKFVRKVCSAQFASEFETEIVNQYTDEEAFSALVRQLSKLQFLILFDDVWNIDARILKLFNRISAEIQNLTNSTLKQIISTRSETIAVDFHAIPVDPLPHDGENCKRMLCQYVGIEYSIAQNMPSSDREAFEFILKKCSGLPLALAVAGRAVKRKRKRGNDWVWFASDLRKSIEKLGDACQHHPGLLSSITLSLRDMQLNWMSEKVSPERAFQSLSVLEKQMTIPAETLAKIWGTSEADANRVVDRLEENSLVTTTFEYAGDEGEGWKGIQMHDLMNDMSVHLAGEEEMSDWHKCLVDSYAVDIGGSSDRDESLPWWDVRSPSDYIRDEIVRHMVRCERRDEALNLLTDYRWIEKMNGVKNTVPFQSVISGLKLLRRDMKDGSIASEIDLIIATMMKCLVPYCLKNPRECSFQLYGRLVSLGSKSMIVERLLWSIVRYASRPWVRAGPGVLESASRSLKRVLPVGFCARRMEWGIGSEELIVGGEDGNLKCINCIDATVQNTFSGHEQWISELCVDIPSGFIYSCSEDGTLIQWKNTEVSRKLQVSLQVGEQVSCMTMLEKRDAVAVGTWKSRIITVDMRSGEVIKSIRAHTDAISSLTVAKDGDLLVSASFDHSIKIWDAESLEAIGDALLGHTDSVLCVAVSSDDQMIASGSRDKTVRIWDVKKRREMCPPLTAHIASVGCVTFSRDGRRWFSGGPYKICVWDTSSVKDGVRSIRKLQGERMGEVQSLRSRSNNPELWALNFRGQIFVWKANKALRGSKYATEARYVKSVSKISISQDGRTIVKLNKEETRFDVHYVEDVHLGADLSIASFHVAENISKSFIDGLSVSNDGKFVACSLILDQIVNLFEAKSGKVVFRFEELQRWWNSFKQSNRSMHPRYIDLNFDEDDISLTAQFHYILDEEDGIHSISWNLSTGEQLNPSSHVPSTPDVNASTTDGERNTIARIFCERRKNSGYLEGVQCTAESDTFRIATLERGPESSAYSRD